MEATEPVVLVLGGAGSGKTTTALGAAQAALSGAATPPWSRVLFLTFSRTAVAQLRTRLRDAGLSDDIANRLEISTFHGFAFQLLHAFGSAEQRETKLLSPAERRLFDNVQGITYDDLIPTALELLQTPDVVAILRKRWALVICDEFQDTSDEEWALLDTVAAWSRLLLMADPNQTIYEDLPGKNGVGASRIAAASGIARVIQLPAISFRDTTNLMPAVADEIRRRIFDGIALRQAIGEGRITVAPYAGDAESRADSVVAAIRGLADRGNDTVGVFLQGNAPVAELSDALADRNVEHVLIGVGEAYGEALRSMALLAAHGAGLESSDAVHASLAAFLTACRRTRDIPVFARYLLGQGDIQSEELRALVPRLETRLRESESTAELISRAISFWSDLRIQTGQGEWRRAIGTFRALARFVAPTERERSRAIKQLLADAETARIQGMIGLDDVGAPTIGLMNFHQTKGREADASILVFCPNEFFGYEAEPFEKLSRLMYVALTRARKDVTILIPPNPHGIVAPLRQYLDPGA